MSPIRRVGQPQAQESRRLQFKVREPGYGDGDAVHLQASGRQVNRSYGAASNVPFSDELGSFLGGLHQAGALPHVTSLATSRGGYMSLDVRRNGDSFVLSGPVEDAPLFAYSFVQNGRIEFEVDGEDLPSNIRESLS